MDVIKRNGKVVPFSKEKIIRAISKAGHIKGDLKEKIAAEIEKCGKKQISIEEIQDIVEKKLMASSYKNVAKEYIRYRYKRELIREHDKLDNNVLEVVSSKNEYVNGENSNKNPALLSTQRDYMAGEVSKEISRKLLLDDEIINAHDEGIIHFHDMDYFAQRMFNCFSGGTKFLTEYGPKQFRDFQDGETVYVKDLNGVTRKATVRCYGNQDMNTVTLKNFKGTYKVICTANHRWMLKDGSITTNLCVGDALYGVNKKELPKIETKEEAEAFTLGFIIGDGSDTKNNRVYVRLCGNKCQYAHIFEKAEYRRVNCTHTDDLYYSKHYARKQAFLESKAWRFMDVHLREILFYGYYCADGAKQANSVATSDERMCAFIEENCSLAGYYITSKDDEIRDTPFKSGARLITYRFTVKTPANQCWRVIKIEPYKKNVPAWCIEEPVTHTFLLEKGIVTGNCCLVNLEDMLQNGTVINGTKIETPHSFSTACNIATQVMAAVASSQYGRYNV